jgi:hypothetical protein
LLFAVGDEDRVEAESFGAARLRCDPALEDSRAAKLVVCRRKRNELADVAGSPAAAFDAFELVQETVDVHASCEPGRLDARRAAQALDFETRVLAQDPRAGSVDGSAEVRFRPGVLVVRVARLRRVVVRVERLELPGRQRGA